MNTGTSPTDQSPASGSERLFTPRFFMMCGFTFTVFLSAFQLFPTAPFRIEDLGGSKFAAGLFLGFLTYASAFSAPFTGGIADRIGRKKMLILSSGALTVFAIAYGLSPNYYIPLVLVVFHGMFWSGLLSASSAYLLEIVPQTRRTEGIAYWGLSSVLAIAVAPNLGLWIYQYGWTWLCVSIGLMNLLMIGLAIRLPDSPPHPHKHAHRGVKDLVEWKILALSFTLFLYSFGYGGITSFSAMYAQANGVVPSGIYFTSLAIVILLTRPFSGPLADRVGKRRVFIPCLVLIFIGLAILAFGGSMPFLIMSSLVFGVGFGTAYPVFAAHVMDTVDPGRRGAGFGSILAAFDTGIGSGSIMTGWLVEQYGFPIAFGAAAVLSALSLPYFLIVEKRVVPALPHPSDGGSPGVVTESSATS